MTTPAQIPTTTTTLTAEQSQTSKPVAPATFKVRPQNFGTPSAPRTRFVLSYRDAQGSWHTFPGTFTDREQAKRQGRDLAR